MKDILVSFEKLEDDRQIVYGAVYSPMIPDSQGDFMTAKEIERIAHDFIKKQAINKIDTEHDLLENGSAVVESFIAREGDPDFVPGSWVLGVHIPDKGIWRKVKKGEINGFSMYGSGRREQRIIEIEIPDDGVIKGDTATGGALGHSHRYSIRFDSNGAFLGGETDEVEGHKHFITKGTATDRAGIDKHLHRFSFVEALAKSITTPTDNKNS